MEQEFTEEEVMAIAAQLRKPEGEQGIEIGQWMNTGNRTMNLHALAVLDVQPEEHVLEIGMGCGLLVSNILSLDPSITYSGCDYSALMVQKATENNMKWVDASRARFMEANIQQLPFNDNDFDRILTVNTFYFWEDYEQTLLEIKRVLKPSGTFVLAVRPKENMEQYPVVKFGFTVKSNQEILDLLVASGFVSVEITEIKEPDQNRFGGVVERSSAFFSCKTEFSED